MVHDVESGLELGSLVFEDSPVYQTDTKDLRIRCYLQLIDPEHKIVLCLDYHWHTTIIPDTTVYTDREWMCYCKNAHKKRYGRKVQAMWYFETGYCLDAPELMPAGASACDDVLVVVRD